MPHEIHRRYVNKVETQLPEFLREIADMRDIGMTLQGSIFMISGNKTGVLSSQVKVVSDELKCGSSLAGALVRMEERIGLVSVKRAISLLVKASEVTDYIWEILTIAIAHLEHYLKMKSKRLNVSFVYLAVISLSFGIYLYSATYVPGLKQRSEILHSGEVQYAFQRLSSDVDNLYALGRPAQFSEPVPLGGGDILLSPVKSSGTIELQQKNCQCYDCWGVF